MGRLICKARPSISSVVALLLAFCSAVSYDCLDGGGVRFSAHLLVRFIVLALLYCVVGGILVKGIKLIGREPAQRHVRSSQREDVSPKYVLRTAGIILVCWSPYLFLLYPGNISMDASVQLASFAEYANTCDPACITDHHPVFDTLTMSIIIWGIYSLTGSFGLATFTYVILQAIFTAAAFAYSAVVMKCRWHVRPKLVRFAILFFALFPHMPIMVCLIAKDTLFSWVFLLFFVEYVTILISISEGDTERKRIALLFGWGFLSCLTKKLGVYVVVPSLIFLIVFSIAKKRELMRLLLVGTIACGLVSGVALPTALRAVGVSRGGIQEMLSIPLQQTARSVLEHGGEMTAEEKVIIGKVLELDTLETDYWPANADGVKGYQPRGTNAEYASYIRLWIKQGFEYPQSYLSALVCMEAPLFVPTPMKPYFDSELTSRSNVFPENYWMKSGFNEKGSDFVCRFYYWIRDVPILELFFISFTYTVGLSSFLFVMVLRSSRRLEGFAVLCPVALTLAGIMASPIIGQHTESTRYILPMVYLAPVILGYITSRCIGDPNEADSSKCDHGVSQNRKSRRCFSLGGWRRKAANSLCLEGSASACSERRKGGQGA